MAEDNVSEDYSSRLVKRIWLLCFIALVASELLLIILIKNVFCIEIWSFKCCSVTVVLLFAGIPTYHHSTGSPVVSIIIGLLLVLRAVSASASASALRSGLGL